MSVSLSPLRRPDSPAARHDYLANYSFGRTLGTGTYGVVREADGPTGKVAVKIILKKKLEGNEHMLYDEIGMLRTLKHPHIIKFVDWFESRDRFYIVTQLATGGELFDRICDQGKFTEKDAARTVKQILSAIDYLHENNVVHRDLKPENLLYLTRDPNADLVLVDFGIAKSLKSRDDTLSTMAGSFGYAAPEVMGQKGYGKPVDMWSLGVITYTLLCGYMPFHSENLPDLLHECTSTQVVFPEPYWKEVSQDARDFVRKLIVPNPELRWTSKQAMCHSWLTGKNATEHDLVPELLEARKVRRRFKHAILAASLKKRIEDIKEGVAEEAVLNVPSGSSPKAEGKSASPKDKMGGAMFREVVLAELKENKQRKEALKVDQELENEVRRSSSTEGPRDASEL